MLTQLYTRGRIFIVLALFAIIGVAALWGQAVNGTISGTVTDPSGAAIAGAMVEVRNTATQVVRTVTTNAQGRYTVPELFVGNYE
ncbi:MAG: carboxypeptidase-like regulatory domain-containing protein [Bryobacteraceae bacterium]|jgi:protocatechuate 3,4-dioxygenase beta subunit